MSEEFLKHVKRLMTSYYDVLQILRRYEDMCTNDIAIEIALDSIARTYWDLLRSLHTIYEMESKNDAQ